MIFGRLKELTEENNRLKKELTSRSEIVALFKESIPLEQNERKEYMSRIALFYNTVFKSKLRHMIGEQLLALGRIGLTREEENIFRSNINCLRLIDEWFNERTNEHIGNLEEARGQIQSTFDIINDVKQRNNLI